MLTNITVDLYFFSPQTSQHSCPFILCIPSFDARFPIFKDLIFKIFLFGMFAKYNIK